MLIMASFALSACGVAAPDAGQEAVLVKKPVFFGHGGVADEPVKTGLSFTAFTTDAVYVDMRPVQWNIPFEDLMSKDGVPLHFDAALRVQVVDSVDLIKNFGPKWFKNNLEAEVRNRVRQSVRKFGMNETAIDTKAIDAIDAEVTKAVESYIKTTKLPVKLIKFTVGKVNPPDAIKTQRVASANEEQRRMTEIQTQAAEVERKKAEQARAEADNAYRQQMSLTPAQFVALKDIEMKEKVCAQKPCTFIVGDSASVLVGK